MEKTENASKCAQQNHSHAWRGTWNRPMKIDENSQHPLTIARMTDHNVRGSDEEESEKLQEIEPQDKRAA